MPSWPLGWAQLPHSPYAPHCWQALLPLVPAQAFRPRTHPATPQPCPAPGPQPLIQPCRPPCLVSPGRWGGTLGGCCSPGVSPIPVSDPGGSRQTGWRDRLLPLCLGRGRSPAPAPCPPKPSPWAPAANTASHGPQITGARPSSGATASDSSLQAFMSPSLATSSCSEAK